MKRAFTLLELLLVVAILGIMGTVTLGGYHAFERGMAERGTIVNMNHFLKQCWQRAQIDRMPIYVYCWNELLKEEDEELGTGVTVVGRAIAIRRAGRISAVDLGEGLLHDEFGDLRFNSLEILTSGIKDQYAGGGQTKTAGNESWIYMLHGSSQKPERTLVSQFSERCELTEADPRGENSRIPITSYAFRCSNRGDAAQWRPGYAYGVEFSTITLPHGFVFGSSVPKTMDTPEVFVDAVRYNPGEKNSRPLQISHLRLNSGGEFEPVNIGSTDPPYME